MLVPLPDGEGLEDIPSSVPYCPHKLLFTPSPRGVGIKHVYHEHFYKIGRSAQRLSHKSRSLDPILISKFAFPPWSEIHVMHERECWVRLKISSEALSESWGYKCVVRIE